MWNIIYYTRENGTIPVQELISSLPAKFGAKILFAIDLLEQRGISLREPYVKQMDGKLWELRIKFSSDISRILYFVPQGKDIVLLHGFVKKTQKTPAREIETARRFMADYQRRDKE